MGWYDKYIPKEIRKPIDKVVRGVSKITDKLIPNELRFLAPYATGIASLALPPGMSPLVRGLLSAGYNSLGQIAADETPTESFGDLNTLSMALQGGLGALGSTPQGTAQGAAGATTPDGRSLREVMTSNEAYRGGVPKPEMLSPSGSIPFKQGIPFKAPSTDVGFLEGLKNVSGKGLESLQDVVRGGRSTLADFGENPSQLFTKDGIKAAAAALAPTATLATGDVAYEAAIDAQKLFEETEAAELAQAGASLEEIENARRAAIRSSMLAAKFTEEEILDTLDQIGLKDGGIASLKDGGMLNFGGREMDLRTGGFVPIGRKERADDVPARLSKNEFVMTADAVRAAGGGSVNKGAQRMYDIMNQLEARA